MESSRRASSGDSNTIEGLVACVEAKIDIEPLTPKRSWIYEVPERLRKVSPDAFTPQIISIGPYHHCKLSTMENHKVRYLHSLLDRCSSTAKLTDFVQALKDSEESARSYYSEPLTNFTSNQFVELMLLDGCFIIEFFIRNFIRSSPKSPNITKTLSSSQSSKPKYDPLFDTLYTPRALEADLLLLENQIPFFILNQLFELANGPSHAEKNSFLDLALQFFRCDPSLIHDQDPPVHFLDLVFRKYKPTIKKPKRKNDKNQIDEIKSIPSASELRLAGVKFKAVNIHTLSDIKFDRSSGLMEIPVIEVGEHTETILRNLVAYEHCCDCNSYVGDYTTVIDHLIYNEQDAEMLRRRDIITNWLGDDKEVAKMLKALGKKVVVAEDYFYAGLYDDVNAYYKNPRHNWIATLRRQYFETPGSIIAFIAATIILICTIMQATIELLGELQDKHNSTANATAKSLK